MSWTKARDVYARLGWELIPAFPPGYRDYAGRVCDGKVTYETGVTGRNARPMTDAQVLKAENYERDGIRLNALLKMPLDVDGYDVIALDLDMAADHNRADTPDGYATVASLEGQGMTPLDLPHALRNGHTPDWREGHYLFRVPTGRRWTGTYRGIDTITPWSRTIAVYPSVHKSGQAYCWWRGADVAEPPSLQDVPLLPDDWISLLSSPDTPDTHYAKGEYTPHDGGTWCNKLKSILAGYAADPTRGGGSRHDAFTRVVRSIAECRAEGHHGAEAAAAEAVRVFSAAVGEDRDATAEAQRAVVSAFEKYGGTGGGEDPCVTLRRHHDGFKPVPDFDMPAQAPVEAPVAPSAGDMLSSWGVAGAAAPTPPDVAAGLAARERYGLDVVRDRRAQLGLDTPDALLDSPSVPAGWRLSAEPDGRVGQIAVPVRDGRPIPFRAVVEDVRLDWLDRDGWHGAVLVTERDFGADWHGSHRRWVRFPTPYVRFYERVA